VNTKVLGEVVPSLGSLEESAIETLEVGCALKDTVNESVVPSSRVTSPLVGATRIVAVSLSKMRIVAVPSPRPLLREVAEIEMVRTPCATSSSGAASVKGAERLWPASIRTVCGTLRPGVPTESVTVIAEVVGPGARDGRRGACSLSQST
jgi:hypothetical protein